MDRCVCIHGHFYQPPRENPWLEEVEFEQSSYPYHDWNGRITAECYEPNTASRIIAPDHRIIAIVNNYTNISFNFGPTLLSWLERHDPSTYGAILEADRLSAKRFSGHGSAMAQAYNHMIMPLSNRRDKQTQLVWGIADFRHRFQREPEGLWLPETAADTETLEILSELGIKFTVLAPHQAARYRRIGEEPWIEGKSSIDPKKAYLCHLPSGRSINIFFYDGLISKDVAFSTLLNSGESFAKRLLSAFTDEETPQLVSIATDGESYGHHHKFGDMALAYCLHYMESQNLACLTNYAEFLEKHPPGDEVQIVENSSWSCTHGVERWKSDCGCNTGKGFHQKWRAPLREAMDWLRDALAELFEREASMYFKDPWGTRDKYVEVVLDRSRENVERFLAEASVRPLTKEEKILVLKLLELQRHSMLMYTSCGWFFDEISGIEGVQVMKYALRAMQLARGFDLDLEGGYLERLRRVPSNIPELGDGANIFRRFVKPASLDLLSVASHYAISSLFNGSKGEESRIFCYTVKDEAYEVSKSGKIKLTVGRSLISSDITWENDQVSYAVLWLGDHNIYGGARVFCGKEAFSSIQKELFEGMKDMEIHRTIFLINKIFKKTGKPFSLRDLFRDRQAEIISKIMEGSVKKADFLMKIIQEDNHPAMYYLKDMGIAPPHTIEVAADASLNSEILSILRSDPLDLDAMEALVDEIKLFGIKVQRDLVSLEASFRAKREFELLLADPLNIEKMKQIERLLKILFSLQIEMNLWRAQNIAFGLMSNSHAYMKELEKKGDKKAAEWVSSFASLCNLLGVNV
jgi:alpha-amylase/alpha-mannosidase (GH57 family)